MPWHEYKKIRVQFSRYKNLSRLIVLKLQPLVSDGEGQGGGGRQKMTKGTLGGEEDGRDGRAK